MGKKAQITRVKFLTPENMNCLSANTEASSERSSTVHSLSQAAEAPSNAHPSCRSFSKPTPEQLLRDLHPRAAKTNDLVEGLAVPSDITRRLVPNLSISRSVGSNPLDRLINVMSDHRNPMTTLS